MPMRYVLVTARILSMKSSASGLSDRFLRATILTVLRAPGNSTGKTLSVGSMPGNLSEYSEDTVKNRPASRVRCFRNFGPY